MHSLPRLTSRGEEDVRCSVITVGVEHVLLSVKGPTPTPSRPELSPRGQKKEAEEEEEEEEEEAQRGKERESLYLWTPLSGHSHVDSVKNHSLL